MKKDINNNITVLKCRDCGEFLHVEKVTENWKDEKGLKRQRTFHQLRCPACNRVYE